MGAGTPADDGGAVLRPPRPPKMLTDGSAGEDYGDRTARFEGVLFSSGLAHVRANDVGFLYRLRHRSLPAPQTSGPCQNHRMSVLRGCVNRVIGRTRGRRLWNRAERSRVAS